MGDRLKFSFGHVIAFVSLMFIGYVTFMGAVYFSGANFEWALFSVLVEVVGLLVLLMLLQKMKTVQHHFKRNIWIERAFLLLLLAGCCYAFTHFMKFWNVFENRHLVSARFSEATAAADSMFVGYDNYSGQRIRNHEARLKNYYNLSEEQLLYQVNDSILHIKLQSEAYRDIETRARKWIASTSRGVSVWNVFMMSNEKKMASIIDDWHGMLVSMSEGQISTEENAVSFDSDGYYINNVQEKIFTLEKLFSTDGFTPWSLIGVPFFLFLFLPYIIQDRYFRSTYILFCPHSAVDSKGCRRIYWGRDKSWVQRHVSNVVIDTETNTNKQAKIVEKLRSYDSDCKPHDIVTHFGDTQEDKTERIVHGGINDKEYKTEKIVLNKEQTRNAEMHRRRRGQTFDYDKEEEPQSIITHL